MTNFNPTAAAVATTADIDAVMTRLLRVRATLNAEGTMTEEIKAAMRKVVNAGIAFSDAADALQVVVQGSFADPIKEMTVVTDHLG